MGSFFDSIEDELNALDAEFGGEGGGPIRAHRAAGSLLLGQEHAAFGIFGVDYDANTNVVRQVQAAINALGYVPPLTVDGSYGPATRAGVSWFQARKNLTADGVITDATLKALEIKPAAPTNWLQPVAQAPIAGLAQPVVDAFPSFSTKYEGYTPYMYADSKGLVTTGIGNLIDPIGLALRLPWKRPDGSLATQDEITAAWNAVKNAYPGVQSTASQSLTNLRLDKEGIAELVHSKMAENQGYLLQHYPNVHSWPADAQLALHSISWAWGPGFANVWGQLGQQFMSAVNAAKPDFVTAASIMRAASQHEESINPGIVPRDAANTLMFNNAAKALASGDLTALAFPLDYVGRHPLRTAGIVAGVLAFVGGVAALALRRA